MVYDRLRPDIRAMILDVSDVSGGDPKKEPSRPPPKPGESPQERSRDPHEEGPLWPGGGKKGESEKREEK